MSLRRAANNENIPIRHLPFTICHSPISEGGYEL
jgi:hypothetical protein